MPAMSLMNRVQLTTLQKGVIISIGTGVALLAVVAQYLKRRRKTPSVSKNQRKTKMQSVGSGPATSTPYNGGVDRGSTAGSLRSGSPGMRVLNRQPSVLSALSDRLSNAGLGPQDVSKLTPQQLGAMAIEDKPDI
ncbi:hypothetical protein GE061_009562 [Apolygus lucorum]|uniref:Uncharacterized protein n=1 Tax=Apolygus lucorum TaxID=248454 RepID=A0A6A4JV20_APOLU|nr:hypothetical protein GE061_009562 [Apolygus lucorum]